MARPSKYKSEYTKIASKMCDLGATDQDLADVFDVDVRTIYRWKVQNKEFCQALSTAKEGYDDRIERSLAMRAIGYTHDEIDIRVVNGEIVETPITKHYPPDTKAALAWLYNRRPEKWHPQPNGDKASEDLAETLRLLSEKLPD